jgi:F-type H+-transporting ATPase subunit delta
VNTFDPVTARWADALYNLARRQGVLAEIERDLGALAAALGVQATRAVVFNPRVEREAKRAQLGPALAPMHPLTRNVIHLLLDRGREEVLRGLRGAIARRGLEERGVATGVVESARPIERRELDAIAASVGVRLGKKLELENRVVPELVGGVRVIAANRMIDSSVQGRLEGLRRRMMEVKMPSASGL